MKLMSFTALILIASLTVIAVWGIGMLTVRASAVSTQASIDLLRIHLRVERLHAQLVRHSRDTVAAEIKTLRPNRPAPATGIEPWPEEAAKP